ncbi:MAG: DUF4340 domain-containing protein [Kiritimatiellia bacterium]|nr:DUF4340 domain-containing protein [Lentisphaerota bacterium]
MKTRNLLFLLLAMILTGTCAYRGVLKTRRGNMPEQVGRALFDDLPVNEVAAIVIETPHTNLVVRRAGETWVVAGRYDYPAKFEKVAYTIRGLRDLKVGQVVPGGDQRLGELQLLEPGPENPVDQQASRLELRDGSDRALANVLIGRHFIVRPQGDRQAMMGGGYPAGHYLRLPDGTVIIVGQTLDRMIETAEGWLDETFVTAAAASLREISVSGPEREEIVVSRAPDSNKLILKDLTPEEGLPDDARLSSLFGGLNYLSFRDVADPALPPATTGLDDPIVLKAQVGDGLCYIMKIGAQVDNGADRYVAVDVEYKDMAGDESDDSEASADERRKQAAELHARLSPWIYILGSHRLEPLLRTRAELIKDAPPAGAGDDETIDEDEV